MHRSHFLPLLVLAAWLGVVGCGDLGSDQEAKRRAAAQATLDQAAESLRNRVSQTCERWKDHQGECDSDRVYADVLDCWTEKGLPHLKAALGRGIRKRARERRVVMHHSLCMEKHGWRLIPGSGGYF
ncbi:MAG: hypothetical protein JRH16_07490 [Deltaproteobacteria bacterium]|nr:hypothetical protein [Deltaproteobacteria bacterium]